MSDFDEIRRLVAGYGAWLKDKTTLKALKEGWIEVTTPFLDRHNDYLQIYARKDENGYSLTDDGYTIRDLEMSGCILDTPKRKSLMKVALAGFAVEESAGTLFVKATSDNFAARKHALTQAMLAVNDLFYTAQSTVRSLFKEDVQKWLDLIDARYILNAQFTGKTGYVHHFDFAIPRSKDEPERILKAINHPTKDAAQSLIFSWLDTKENRPDDALAIAVLNDAEHNINNAVLDAFQQYDITSIRWSEREKSRAMIAA